MFVSLIHVHTRPHSHTPTPGTHCGAAAVRWPVAPSAGEMLPSHDLMEETNGGEPGPDAHIDEDKAARVHIRHTPEKLH